MFFFGRLKRWWFDRQRNIFRYWDGRLWRYGDPIAIGTRLQDECPDYLDYFSTVFDDPDKLPAGSLRENLKTEQKKAQNVLIDASRKVLGIEPWDDVNRTGLMIPETLRVLGQYLHFMNQLAEDSRPFGNSPGPVADSRQDSTIEHLPDVGGAETQSVPA